VRAFDDFEPDGPPPKPRAEEVLDVADERRKDVFKIVVVIGRIVAGAAFGGREGRELAG
jgi:hypothetical protein